MGQSESSLEQRPKMSMKGSVPQKERISRIPVPSQQRNKATVMERISNNFQKLVKPTSMAAGEGKSAEGMAKYAYCPQTARTTGKPCGVVRNAAQPDMTSTKVGVRRTVAEKLVSQDQKTKQQWFKITDESPCAEEATQKRKAAEAANHLRVILAENEERKIAKRVQIERKELKLENNMISHTDSTDHLASKAESKPERIGNFVLSSYSKAVPVRVGNYQLGAKLGKGYFANVLLAVHMPTGKQVALKIIDKTRMDAETLRMITREATVLRLLHHPNIIKLYEVIESKSKLYMAMEYITGGELLTYIEKRGPLSEAEARFKFKQLVEAVLYCHRKRIVHRDLKVENLLLDDNQNIILIDFGFSNHLKPGWKLKSSCGSPPYAAPELFLSQTYNGPEVDVWSLGVVLHVMLTGVLPFDGESFKDVKNAVLRGTYQPVKNISKECGRLMKRFLTSNPRHRITLSEALDDKWLRGNGPKADLCIMREAPLYLEDEERICKLMSMGYTKTEIINSLMGRKYDAIFGTYMLLEKSMKPRIPKATRAETPRYEKCGAVDSPKLAAVNKEIYRAPRFQVRDTKSTQTDTANNAYNPLRTTLNTHAAKLPIPVQQLATAAKLRPSVHVQPHLQVLGNSPVYHPSHQQHAAIHSIQPHNTFAMNPSNSNQLRGSIAMQPLNVPRIERPLIRNPYLFNRIGGSKNIIEGVVSETNAPVSESKERLTNIINKFRHCR